MTWQPSRIISVVKIVWSSVLVHFGERERLCDQECGNGVEAMKILVKIMATI